MSLLQVTDDDMFKVEVCIANKAKMPSIPLVKTSNNHSATTLYYITNMLHLKSRETKFGGFAKLLVIYRHALEIK